MLIWSVISISNVHKNRKRCSVLLGKTHWANARCTDTDKNTWNVFTNIITKSYRAPLFPSYKYLVPYPTNAKFVFANRCVLFSVLWLWKNWKPRLSTGFSHIDFKEDNTAYCHPRQPPFRRLYSPFFLTFFCSSGKHSCSRLPAFFSPFYSRTLSWA